MTMVAYGSSLKTQASQLLAKDSVFRAFQTSLRFAHGTRRRLERNLLRSISLLNLPSRYEITRIEEQLGGLETEVQHIAYRLASLRAQLEKWAASNHDTNPPKTS